MGSSHLIAAVVFFIIQLISMGIIYWLIKKLQEKDLVSLIPIMNQFKGYFALIITVWIALAVVGYAAHLVGRIYSITAIIIFIGLSSSLTHQLFVTSDLLAPYFKDNNKDKGEGDKYDQRNR